MQETGARQVSTTTYPYAFQLVSSVDHITGAPGKSPVVKLSKNAASGVSAVGAITEVDSANHPGWYALAGNATDRNTLGECLLHVTATGCDPVDRKLDIVGYDPFDTYWGIPGFSRIQSITSATITFVSPVNASGSVLTVTASTDYYNADGLAARWTGITGFPSFSGAQSATFTAEHPVTHAVLVTATVTVVNATDLYVELTAAQTAALVNGSIFDIKVVLANGHSVRPVAGTVVLTQAVTP
jgi:hypothetical protein